MALAYSDRKEALKMSIDVIREYARSDTTNKVSVAENLQEVYDQIIKIMENVHTP